MHLESGSRVSMALGVLWVAVSWTPLAAAPADGPWTLVDSPNPGPAQNRLIDVTRLGSNGVLALGREYAEYFGLEWGGTEWLEIAMPPQEDIGMGYALDSLGSTPGGDVWAVGIVGIDPFTGLPLAMRYNGTEWDRIETVPLEPAGRNGHVFDVSAVSDDDIWAVGNSDGPLAVHWDGSEWTENSPPAPGNRIHDTFAVAAVASDDVWAVGHFENVAPAEPLGFYPMILHWDGTSWSHFPNPGQALERRTLLDVEAVAADDVWVSGYWWYGLCEHPSGASYCDPFFMHWDGSEWSVVPSPADTERAYVSELTAFASDDIWASTGAEYMHWDGTEWSVVAAPEVPGAETVRHGSGMVAVGPDVAWSVGRWEPADGGWTRTLSERYRASLFADGFESGDTSAWSAVVP